ncbi:MAG: hypothetical protein IJ890_07735 [Clostridia bacterium]|nr:hypothetical protein [Clostridia bacterium]
MEINEQKRQKFMENASKRVNNVMHNIQILEPMARSNTYDFTRNDVEEMFAAMQETLDNTKAEFIRKLEGSARTERKAFSFGQSSVVNTMENKDINNVEEISENISSSEEVVGEVGNITE